MGRFVPTGDAYRILDFDIENRPLSYWVPDMPTAEITAIASCWADDLRSMQVDCLGEMDGPTMLARFVERYNQADIVTGHYITRHDLPIINAMLMECGLPLLGPKGVIDTKTHMMKKADLPATQEFLLETLGVLDVYGQPIRKFHMTQVDWREANRLTPEGIAKTKARVASDVFGHMQLRLAMEARGMLRSPQTWNPGGGASGTPGRTSDH
jgi:hypothetical protein